MEGPLTLLFGSVTRALGDSGAQDLERGRDDELCSNEAAPQDALFNAQREPQQPSGADDEACRSSSGSESPRHVVVAPDGCSETGVNCAATSSDGDSRGQGICRVVMRGAQSQSDGIEEDDSPDCRICKTGEDEGRLLRVCRCRGTLQYVHGACLQKWLESRGGIVRPPEVQFSLGQTV